MLAAGRLEEALPRPVDLGGTGRGILRADRPRQHIGPDAASVVVSCRLGPRRISDDDRGEALAGQVRQVVRCNRLDRLAGVAARGARPGCCQDGSGNEDLLECRDGWSSTLPSRMRASQLPTPAALTRTRSCPAPGFG